ncbi:MAG TPA: ABC transporter permease [Mycobacteriales bacterium]|nr:ABC transporter permease [Mycobacteriales bacterium]
MTDVALVASQIRYEQKSYWRNPGAAFFTFAFPLVFFFILVSLAGNQNDKGDLGTYVHNGHRVAVKLVQYYTPSILSYAVMSACFLAVAMTLVRQREAGILKRMRGTPLPAWAYLGGVVGSAIVVAGLLSVVCVGFAVTVYGAYFPIGHIAPLVVTIALGALAFCALGIAVSSLIPNIDSGPAIINLPYFVLVFISGTYFPISGTLNSVSKDLPLRPMILSLYTVFDPTNSGSIWSGRDLLVLALWGVGSSVFAVRHFKWTPRR